METEIKPVIGSLKGKAKRLQELIRSSIESKLLAEVEDMSQEEKLKNHYLPIELEIPKAKRDIDKAIDTFINDFQNKEDRGAELLEYLNYWDNEPPYNESKHYKLLHRELSLEKVEASKYTYKEVEDKVRVVLKQLSPEELYNLYIFGVVVTPEDAKRNLTWWIEANRDNVDYYLFLYAVGNWKKIMFKEDMKPEDAISYSAIENHKLHRKYLYSDEKLTPEEEAKNIEEYKERVNKAINKYPKETEAYCRGWAMLKNNYSERAILETAKKILKDEL